MQVFFVLAIKHNRMPVECVVVPDCVRVRPTEVTNKVSFVVVAR